MEKRMDFAPYDCLYRWGIHMGSYPDYIEGQISLARVTKAPLTAIYFNWNDKRWVTAEEIVDTYLRREILGLDVVYVVCGGVVCGGCGNTPIMGCACVSNMKAIGRGERTKGEREGA